MDAAIDNSAEVNSCSDPYEDRQYRQIMLQPYGKRWELGLSALKEALASSPDQSGAHEHC